MKPKDQNPKLSSAAPRGRAQEEERIYQPDSKYLAHIQDIPSAVGVRALRKALQHFGQLKYCQASKPGDAFAEFASDECLAAAVGASPLIIGAGGGVKVHVHRRRTKKCDLGGAGRMRIVWKNGAWK